MADKLSNDPARLKQELDSANERNRTLSKEINSFRRQRSKFIQAQEAAEEAAARADAAEERARVAEARAVSASNALEASESSRDAERRIVESARAFVEAYEFLRSQA